MHKFNTAKAAKTPRLILTVNQDGSATARGFFIDRREALNSLNRTYNSEAQAVGEFSAMRERDCEFSYTINRKA